MALKLTRSATTTSAISTTRKANTTPRRFTVDSLFGTPDLGIREDRPRRAGPPYQKLRCRFDISDVKGVGSFIVAACDLHLFTCKLLALLLIIELIRFFCIGIVKDVLPPI